MNMAGDQISMPSGMGGLTRYFEEYKSKIQFKPGHIVLFVGLLIVFEIGLNLLYWITHKINILISIL